MSELSTSIDEYQEIGEGLFTKVVIDQTSGEHTRYLLEEKGEMRGLLTRATYNPNSGDLYFVTFTDFGSRRTMRRGEDITDVLLIPEEENGYAVKEQEPPTEFRLNSIIKFVLNGEILPSLIKGE
ncbi:MAG TPA: hypothetical protein PK863_00540 [Candidatus Dojkabacteria bacterium]|nr:hypothetical protein [Candidatus Dojkabacteria bacterium]HRP37851.1 hypothetical protein [Candidatus Dojkabacteria bacterium]HRP51050.1 hypothetical protein [Candidatus Dojkabacteria bacterium]